MGMEALAMSSRFLAEVRCDAASHPKGWVVSGCSHSKTCPGHRSPRQAVRSTCIN